MASGEGSYVLQPTDETRTQCTGTKPGILSVFDGDISTASSIAGIR